MGPGGIDQTLPRVCNAGGSGIGDNRHPLAEAERLKHRVGLRRLIVGMYRKKALSPWLDLCGLQQMAVVARVFGTDQICLREHLARPGREII
jgi:hypothetical protein